jgi:O-antigen/teichoic acid export membrane protein
MASNIGQFSKYSFLTLGSQFIVLTVSVVTSIITARVLGPEGKGQLVLILLIPLLSLTFGKFGIGHAVNYYASRVSSTKLILNGLVLSVISGLLLLLLLIPTITILKGVFFEGISKKNLIVISFAVPFYLLTNFLTVLLQGLYKINRMNFLMIVQPVIYLFFVIIFVGTRKMGVDGAILAWVITLLIAFSLSILIVIKEFRSDVISLKIDFPIMRKMLFFGFRTHIGNLLKDLSYRGDILVVSYFLTPASVAYYAIAMNLAELILKIPNAVGLVLLPRISHMSAEDAKSFTPTVLRKVLLPVVAISSLVFFFSDEIVNLAFGKEYLPSSSALLFLLPGVVALTVWKIIANDIIARGHPFKYSLTSALAFLTMIIMDMLLIPKLGINGAAIASSIAYISATFAIILFYRRISGNTFISTFIPIKSDFIIYRNIFTKIWSLVLNDKHNDRK